MSEATRPANQSPPATVLELIERFDRNRDSYKDPRYNETQLRREFLDPFFKALGWDIDNEQGYAEPYKDVIHEDAIKIGEATKAPDYSFRIGGTRKFLLEAKKPAIDIKNDVAPAFQLRRYGFTTRLIGVLSDFEEFAVYDYRVKPNFRDKASVARILYISYSEYAERWSEIAGIFSRDAVLKGSFDKFVESNKVKRGTADVDDEFLKTIEEWRSELAKNLALRNPKLTQRELNFAVQRIIDRIIFLRICEGRGLETYGRLQALGNADRIYPRLCQLFEEADARYNSGLFHFRPEKNRHEAPDELTLKLEIDDKLLRSIFKSIYYPESPYVFSALPAEILGQVYEQFLGKVIRLTEGHTAKVEEKPEVKKAGGVYYTPSYIVDYIVQNTVGKLVSEISPSLPSQERRVSDSKLSPTQIVNRVSKLRVLDPACGSGSFLLGAYEYLLKWHLNFYLDNEPAKWLKGAKPALVQVSGGRYQLTIAERKRILLNNIYGVDIDAQAVETTKLSLLLKVLEGETQQTLQPVLRMFQERALPDLGDNIKCGNSLIGSDFYQQQSLNLLTEEEKYRINVFDWDGKDGFPEIMKGGGFDAVIGNPPWVDIKGLDPLQVRYFFDAYATVENRMNLYAIFLDKGGDLLGKKGMLGFITPSSFLTQSSYERLRIKLLGLRIDTVVRTPDNVFKNVTAESAISILQKEPMSGNVRILIFPPDSAIKEVESPLASRRSISQSAWSEGSGKIFSLSNESREMELLEKVSRRGQPLAQTCEFCLGLTPYDKYKGHSAAQIKARVYHAPTQKDCSWKPLIEGADIRRYIVIHAPKEFIHYGPWLGAPRDPRFFTQPRILVRQIISGVPGRIFAGFTEDEAYNTQVAFNLIARDAAAGTLKLVLAVLNSTLMTWFHRAKFLDRNKNVFQKILIQDAKTFPMPVLDGRHRREYTRCVALVDQMLDLHRRLPAAKTPQEKTAIERQIAATDAQIDKLVYELYGLTEEEIQIVEGKSETEAVPAATEVASEPSPKPKPDDLDGDMYGWAKEEPTPYKTN